MSENIPKKGERKSLFSIQVDDLIIQRIFKTLEDEICKIRIDITDIQAKVSEKAEKNDLVALKMDLREYKEKSSLFRDKVEGDLLLFHEDLNTTISDAKKYVRDQITEATVSLNGVVRAQNAIIEERIFQLSRPDSEITHLLTDFERIKRVNTTLSEKLSNIESFFSSFLNDPRDSNKTLPEIISHYFDPEREQIKKIEQHQKQSDERIQEIENDINSIVGSKEIIFPEVVKAEKHQFQDKPKLPPIPVANSYTDYFQYMMTAFPVLQKILSSFYHQIVGLSNSVYDQAERETSQEDLERALLDLTNTIADVRELKENQNKFDEITSQIEKVKTSQQNLNEMMSELNKLKEITMSKNEVEDEIKKAVSEVLKEIQLLKKESSLQNESKHLSKNKKTVVNRQSLPNTILIMNNINKNQNEEQLFAAPKTVVTSSAPIPQPPHQQLTQEKDEKNSKILKQKQPPDSSSPPLLNEEKEKVDDTPLSNKNSNNNTAANSPLVSPNGSAKSKKKVSSAVQSPRIMKPSVILPSSAASATSMPETVVTAVQPKGRAAYRMIFGDGSGSRPVSPASSTASSRMSNFSNINLYRAEDIEEGGKAHKRTQKTANPVIMSSDCLPEEKDDSLDFFNIL